MYNKNLNKETSGIDEIDNGMDNAGVERVLRKRFESGLM